MSASMRAVMPVVREGCPTTDRRVVAAGTTTWELPIPLLSTVEDGHDLTLQLGEIRQVWRDDPTNVIFAVATFDLTVLTAEDIELMVIEGGAAAEAALIVGESRSVSGTLMLSGCRLAAVTLGNEAEAAWPGMNAVLLDASVDIDT